MKIFVLYCFVGVLNTLIGFGIIFVLIFFGVFAELANFLGYFIGIVCSFFLNDVITFSQVKINKKKGLFKFILSMGSAYIINFLVFFMSYRVFEINVYLSQIIAGGGYTICGFFMSKNKIWKK